MNKNGENRLDFARQGGFCVSVVKFYIQRAKTPLMGIYGEEKTIKKMGHEL